MTAADRRTAGQGEGGRAGAIAALPEAERRRRRASIEAGRASSRLEGGVPDPQNRALQDRYVRGEISAEEWQRRTLQLVAEEVAVWDPPGDADGVLRQPGAPAAAAMRARAEQAATAEGGYSPGTPGGWDPASLDVGRWVAGTSPSADGGG